MKDNYRLLTPNPIICSHYVPKRHLKRFRNENGKLIVYHHFGKKRDEVSDFRNMKLLGLNNFYDFCIDPDDKDSNEKRFEKIENRLGDEIDKLLNGDCYNSKMILQYISFLDSRSLSKRILIEQFEPYRNNPIYANSLDPVKEFHQNLVYSSLYFISTYDIEDYKPMVIKTDDGYELCTSDSPVIEYPRLFTKQIIVNYPEDCPDYPVFICPISPRIAVIAIHVEDYVTEQLINSGYFSSLKPRAINSIMIGLATDALCFTHEPDMYDLAAFKDSDHPRSSYLDTFSRIRDKSPKRIKQKYLT